MNAEYKFPRTSPFVCPKCGCSEGMYRTPMYKICIVKVVMTCRDCGHIFELENVYEQFFEKGCSIGWLELNRATADERKHSLM